MRMDIDTTDLEILSLLIKNSRIPFSQIAKKLGLGESTVYTRIKKLKRLGVLRGFTADVDLSRVGLESEAILEIKPQPGSMRLIIDSLVRRRSVIEVDEVSGEYPIHARIAARDNRELCKRIDEIYSISGVMDMKIKYVLRRVSVKGRGDVLSRILQA